MIKDLQIRFTNNATTHSRPKEQCSPRSQFLYICLDVNLLARLEITMHTTYEHNVPSDINKTELSATLAQVMNIFVFIPTNCV